MEILHKPVLLNECLDFLNPGSSSTLLVDGTLGEGGHSYEFLKSYPNLSVIGVDADVEIQKRAKARLSEFGDRITFFNGWSDDFFRNYNNPKRPDFILIDLGISIFHYEKSNRGFSFSADEPLDMRLNENMAVSATDIINSYKEKKLADLFYEYGEERYSRKIAKVIVERRASQPFFVAKDLADCIYNAVPVKYRHGHLHPATRCFQALRIAVNKELDRLPYVLQEAFKTLNVNGRFAVISFHSLEDRIVKNYFRDLAKDCTCPSNVPMCTCGGKRVADLLTKKAVKPTDSEISVNAPSRSAKLRVIEKIREVRV